MNIGKLNTLMRLERKVVTQDSYGQNVESWQHEAKVWTGRAPSNGREGFTGDRPVSNTPIILDMRYRDNVGPEHRLVHNATVYEIESVEEIERRSRLRLTCHAQELKTSRN